MDEDLLEAIEQTLVGKVSKSITAIDSQLKEHASREEIPRDEFFGFVRKRQVEYVGDVCSAVLHGFGSLLIDGCLKVVGEFKEGKLNGCCEVSMPESWTVKGDFRDGKLQWITRLSVSGELESVYNGGVSKGRADGWHRQLSKAENSEHPTVMMGVSKNGVRDGPFMINQQGNNFKGYYENDQKCKFGAFKNEKYDYLGFWSNNTIEGVGVLQTSHSKYIGELSKGKKNGLGLLKNVVGDEAYTGQFRCDRKEGFGELVVGHTKYVGFFKDNVKEGVGFMTYRNKDTYFGFFREDRREGLGIYLSAGYQVHGEWEKDQLHGKCIFNSEGREAMSLYVNGEPEETMSYSQTAIDAFKMRFEEMEHSDFFSKAKQKLVANEELVKKTIKLLEICKTELEREVDFSKRLLEEKKKTERLERKLARIKEYLSNHCALMQHENKISIDDCIQDLVVYKEGWPEKSESEEKSDLFHSILRNDVSFSQLRGEKERKVNRSNLDKSSAKKVQNESKWLEDDAQLVIGRKHENSRRDEVRQLVAVDRRVNQKAKMYRLKVKILEDSLESISMDSIREGESSEDEETKDMRVRMEKQRQDRQRLMDNEMEAMKDLESEITGKETDLEEGRKNDEEAKAAEQRKREEEETEKDREAIRKKLDADREWLKRTEEIRAREDDLRQRLEAEMREDARLKAHALELKKQREREMAIAQVLIRQHEQSKQEEDERIKRVEEIKKKEAELAEERRKQREVARELGKALMSETKKKKLEEERRNKEEEELLVKRREQKAIAKELGNALLSETQRRKVKEKKAKEAAEKRAKEIKEEAEMRERKFKEEAERIAKDQEEMKKKEEENLKEIRRRQKEIAKQLGQALFGQTEERKAKEKSENEEKERAQKAEVKRLKAEEEKRLKEERRVLKEREREEKRKLDEEMRKQEENDLNLKEERRLALIKEREDQRQQELKEYARLDEEKKRKDREAFEENERIETNRLKELEKKRARELGKKNYEEEMAQKVKEDAERIRNDKDTDNVEDKEITALLNEVIQLQKEEENFEKDKNEGANLARFLPAEEKEKLEVRIKTKETLKDKEEVRKTFIQKEVIKSIDKIQVLAKTLMSFGDRSLSGKDQEELKRKKEQELKDEQTAKKKLEKQQEGSIEKIKLYSKVIKILKRQARRERKNEAAEEEQDDEKQMQLMNKSMLQLELEELKAKEKFILEQKGPLDSKVEESLSESEESEETEAVCGEKNKMVIRKDNTLEKFVKLDGVKSEDLRRMDYIDFKNLPNCFLSQILSSKLLLHQLPLGRLPLSRILSEDRVQLVQLLRPAQLEEKSIRLRTQDAGNIAWFLRGQYSSITASKQAMGHRSDRRRKPVCTRRHRAGLSHNRPSLQREVQDQVEEGRPG